jgi:tRNA pseudouridine13 synthase
MVRDDMQAALDQYLGKPDEQDQGHFLQARRAYDAGEFEKALNLWPYMYRDERRALSALLKSKGNVRRGWFAVDLSLKRLFLSAYQSHLFNRVLAGRIGEIDRVKAGDLAFKHNSGAVFRVEDAAAEQPRAERFEISATGPLFGYRMTQPGGEPGEIEGKLLAEEGLTIEQVKALEGFRLKGSRRPFRFKPHDWSVKPGMDTDGAYLEFRFTLPKGCYATALLREVLKNEAKIGEQEEEDD